MKILQSLSEATGGRVFTVSPTLSLREIYAQIGEDLRLQYALGYTPPADMQPNSYHKLELKAKNNKLTVAGTQRLLRAALNCLRYVMV